MLGLFLKGLILGFSVAAPVGPIGILCINRTINNGFSAGLVSGFGAATADLIYGLIAGLGITAVSGFLINQKLWIQWIGLFFLFYIGIKALVKKENEVVIHTSTENGLLKAYFSTFFLTLTNPMTILFFIAVFAGLGLSVTDSGVTSIIQLIVGVFIGSGIWWLSLSGLTSVLKTKINKRVIKRIDLASGMLLLFYGLYILIELIHLS